MLPVFLYTCVSVTKFSSLNSLLTAEAIGYVNVDKANIMTGEEIYKINVQIWSISGLDLFELPQLVVTYCILGENPDRLCGKKLRFEYAAFILG